MRLGGSATSLASKRACSRAITLALLSRRYWRGNVLKLVGSATAALAVAALLVAGHSAAMGQTLPGAAALMAAAYTGAFALLLLFVAAVRSSHDDRLAEARLLVALGVAPAALGAAAVIEAALVGVLGAVPGAVLASALAPRLLTPDHGGLLGRLVGEPTSPGGAAPWTVGAWLAAFAIAMALERAFALGGRALGGSPAAPLSLRLAASAPGGWGRAGVTAAALTLTVAAAIGLERAAVAADREVASWLEESVTWDVILTAGEGAAAPGRPLVPGAPVAGTAARGPLTYGQSTQGLLAQGQPTQDQPTPGRPTPGRLTQELLEEVAALPGVEEAAPERRAVVGSAGRRVPIVALDPGLASTASRLKVVAGHGGGVGAASLWAGPTAALSVPLATRLGLAVGDDLSLTTSRGEVRFTVTALVEDAAGTDAAYLDLAQYAAAFDDPAIDWIEVRLAEGSDASALLRGLQHVVNGGQVPDDGEGADAAPVAAVATAEEYRASLRSASGAAYAAATAMAIAAAVTAAAGLVLAAGAAWRRREERTLLIALGAPYWLAARSLALEVLVVAGAALLLGSALGVAVGELLPQLR